MKKVLSIVFCVMVALVAFSCNEPQPEPQKPEQEADFVLDVSDVTSTSCRFSVQPKDSQMPYVVMLVEQADFDSFENEWEYQDNDLEWFQRKALEEEKDLSEWLEGFLHKGEFEGNENGLLPGTSYYLYAYGLDYEGYFTTGVTKVAFSTPDIVMSDVTFEISVSEIGLTQAKVSVTASDPKALFFANVFSKQQYEEWGGDETAFANHAAALVDYYVKMGQPLDAIVANLGSVGKLETVMDGLVDDTEYIAYAVGIDENFFVNSKPETVEFKTKGAVQSSNTFKIDITGTTFCSVQGTVTPSNDDPYICAIQPKSQVEGFESDTDLMYEVVATYKQWDSLDDVLFEGEVVDLEKESSLNPETEYVLLCFGWDDAPTTALARAEFTTAAAGGNPRGQEITFALSDITHNRVTVNITPKLGLYYFYDCMPVSKLNEYVETEGSEDEAICRFLDEGIDFGAEYFVCSRSEYLTDLGAAIGKEKWVFTGLEQDSEYIIVAATVNLNTGQIALRKPFKSEVFRTTILIESDAAVEFVIDKYYDGSELAELDPAQFSKCKGMAMVPYEVVPNASAVHWRTAFRTGDFSWAGRDDILYELDYQCDEDKVKGFAVVPYDQLMSFIAIAENDEGYTGPFTIHEFTAKKGGASPAQEFIDSL